MTLNLLKTVLIGGAACGIVATATAVPIFDGREWTEVLLVAKSKNDKVKLYLQAKVDPKTGKIDETKPKEYELKAQYKGKEVKEKLMLCSPDKNKNKNNYYLLKSDSRYGEGFYWKSLEGESKNCEFAKDYDNGFEDPLSIRFFSEPESQQFTAPKEIFLIDCQLKNLSDSSEQITNKNKTSWLITCSKNQWKQTVAEVKIVDQGLFYI